MSGKKVVIGLLLSGILSGVFLAVWRVKTGYILFDFETRSTVSHRVVAEMNDGPAQPASAVWSVTASNDQVIERVPEDGPEPVAQGAVFLPGGFPEPDPALTTKLAERPGFVELRRVVDVELKIVNHDGNALRVDDPGLFAEICRRRANSEALRVRLEGGAVIEIMAATVEGRPGHR